METSTDLANGIYLRGILKKKKLKHGMFEDPYKTKVECWILASTLCIKPIDAKPPASAGVEELDVTVWEVCTLEFGTYRQHLRKFCVSRSGDSRQMVSSRSLIHLGDLKNLKQAPARLQKNGFQRSLLLQLGCIFLHHHAAI
jgi:hypothetical protein